jgi:hypothetical protein
LQGQAAMFPFVLKDLQPSAVAKRYFINEKGSKMGLVIKGRPAVAGNLACMRRCLI